MNRLLPAGLLLLIVAACGSSESPSGTRVDPAPAQLEVAMTREADWTLAPPPVAAQQADLGSIRIHIRLDGTAPGNRVIRMGMDPGCDVASGGQIVTEEGVAVTREGDLANVFVRLEGDFPPVAPPSWPVQIDQSGCVYRPHVVGVQVGQVLEMHNGDDLSHNLHASSRQGNDFNVGQAVEGLVYRYQPQSEEFMLQLGCDIHRWMRSYIGVVGHPYFGVSAPDGSATIRNVPPGTYTLHSWHEIFGDQTTTVEVRAGESTVLEIAYQSAGA
jgi:plastocyanin